MPRMTTFVHEGAKVKFTAASDLAAGDAVKIGNDFYGIAEQSVKSGADVSLHIKGVHRFTAGTSGATAGSPVYLDSGKATVVSASGATTKLGIALQTVASGALVDVLLNE